VKQKVKEKIMHITTGWRE